VLFVTTAKELIHRLLLDQPVGYVREVEGVEKGFALFKKEMLTIHLASESGVGSARFELKEDSTGWQALLRRVVSGEIEQERVGAKVEDAAARAEAEQEAARELPTSCPTCGAPLGQRIVRGVQNLACEYCGAAIRV
jgi:ribosomal protein L37AE/L43A